ncbi:MAG: PD-(D/E)XK nuclease family protein [bacterium]|nr:PD-(D/E)XK nuclease family protein [bacterium]
MHLIASPPLLRRRRERLIMTPARSRNGGTLLDRRLDELAVEWSNLLDARARRERAEAARVAAEWEPTLAALYHETQDLRAEGEWLVGRSDYLGVLGMARAEIRHSALIAWLLDPVGTHGLGTRFLEAILTRLFPDSPTTGLESATPKCEVSRGNRRADIVVSGSGFTLIIENKIDAPEDCNQCQDLYALFGEEPDARFVLLCKRREDGLPQSATGEAKEAFQILTYPELSTDLRKALRKSADGRESPGRSVAEGYLRTLEKEFP